MKTVLIVFGSQYGYTQQYAQWIAEGLEGLASPVLVSTDQLTERLVADADAVVVGMGDYGGFLTGAAQVKGCEAELRVRPLVLFTVSFSGLAGASQEKLDGMLTKNLGAALVDDALGTFHLRGGLDHTRLSLKHKTVMVGIRSAIAALPKKSEANQQMLDSFTSKTVDYSTREQVQPLLEVLKKALK
ncbi:flavodoxin domain-containing protein [Rothia nasimurium]|uniref:flavodoxin domain-containing protein n=1 Tax=Rothia nasimurium TaxID=85336 RepID=UPI001F1EE6FC|nr:flavodoxin domain-containing protein [Rothia nasimurium]